MTFYALSGIVLVFRNTDMFKRQTIIRNIIESNLSVEKLAKEIKIKGLKIIKFDGDILYFKGGNYNRKNGDVVYTKMKLPYLMSKLTALHKSSTKKPLYGFNILFAMSLLFFVISSFWMYLPNSQIFKKGMYFVVAGLPLILILIFV